MAVDASLPPAKGGAGESRGGRMLRHKISSLMIAVGVVAGCAAIGRTAVLAGLANELLAALFAASLVAVSGLLAYRSETGRWPWRSTRHAGYAGRPRFRMIDGRRVHLPDGTGCRVVVLDRTGGHIVLEPDPLRETAEADLRIAESYLIDPDGRIFVQVLHDWGHRQCAARGQTGWTVADLARIDDELVE